MATDSVIDSVEEGIHNSYIDDDDDDAVLMLPSYQLSEIELAYKSGGQDEVRTLLQSQSIEEVCTTVVVQLLATSEVKA